MEARKLNEVRVHELCEQYAAENGGQVPSTTEIILLNGGKGSPSSANIYRKTYLLKVQEKAAAAGADPLANFPEAVANAVKAMQASIEDKAQEQVAVMAEALASKEAEWAEKLDAVMTQLAAAQEENAGLHTQVRELSIAADEQRVENRDLVDRLAQVVGHRQQLETQLEESRKQAGAHKDSLDSLSPVVIELTGALKQLTGKQQQLDERIEATAVASHENIQTVQDAVVRQGQRLEESHQVQQSLIAANTEAAKSVAHQADQYQREIDRLNQQVDDLRQELEKSRQADLAQVEDVMAEKMDNTTALLQNVLEMVSQYARPRVVIAQNGLAEGEAGSKSIKIRLVLRVENNSKFVRGKSKSLKHIEDYHLAHYKAVKISDGEYDLTFGYTDEEDLERQIEGLAREMQGEADLRNGFVECDFYDEESGRTW